ncbi:hypothetical protein T492DRAFT_878924 [Pavlovales sp. CCMP2436]|nr:hypothetical protein T492DRAFT_878924 [Pavlovales sp. CCMP2436]
MAFPCVLLRGSTLLRAARGPARGPTAWAAALGLASMLPTVDGTRGYRRIAKVLDTGEEGLVEGTISKRSAGKFVITLDNGHEVNATRAGRMKAEGRKLTPGRRVQVLFDLEVDFDEQTPKIVALLTETRDSAEEEAKP